MGALCFKCDQSSKENDDSFDEEKDHTSNRKIDFPKQFVNNNIFEKNDEEKEEAILKFEKDEEPQNIEKNNRNSNKYNKSKSTHYKDNEEEIEDTFDNLLINNYIENQEEKEYSGRKSKPFQTVHNPKELNNLDQKNDNYKDIEMLTKNKKEEPIIQRRKKKSTTLMENSNLLKQLFYAEMSIPISQEILVQHQKGNPSDKYIRGKKIGKGTFGSVYESKNIIFNNKVAMKIIPKDYHMDNLLIKNEIDILKKLSHPNIVRIYEFYESNNCFYIINEFCAEGELYNYINNSKLTEEQLSVIFYQVFSGLKYLHENNILHRDLKPENILISKKEIDLLDNMEYFWIQIIDFGTAKIFQNDKNENSVVGSPYYIAPEVLNKNYNEKCDTWSVGVILYMFLVGKPPFNGKDNSEIVNSIMTQNYDENIPKLLSRSEEVKNLIKHLLDKDINKRLSAKEALNHQWFKTFNARKLFKNFKQEDNRTFY